MKGLQFTKFSALLFACAFLFGSCSSRLLLTEKQKQVDRLAVSKLYKEVINNDPDYTSLNAKISVSYESEKEDYFFGGKMKIIKDSVLWISLSPGLGIELARVMVTPDSVLVISRLNNTLYWDDYVGIGEMLQIYPNYQIMQAIFTNAFFVYPPVADSTEAIESLTSASDSSGHLFMSRVTPEIEKQIEEYGFPLQSQYKAIISGKYLRTKNITITDKANKQEFELIYDGFFREGERIVPGSITMISSYNDHSEIFRIEIDKIEFTQEETIRFSVPDDYKRERL